MLWAGHEARKGEVTYAYKYLVPDPEQNISCRRRRYMCKDNIKVDLKIIMYENVDYSCGSG
jgi:hypothetical protein